MNDGILFNEKPEKTSEEKCKTIFFDEYKVENEHETLSTIEEAPPPYSLNFEGEAASWRFSTSAFGLAFSPETRNEFRDSSRLIFPEEQAGNDTKRFDDECIVKIIFLLQIKCPASTGHRNKLTSFNEI